MQTSFQLSNRSREYLPCSAMLFRPCWCHLRVDFFETISHKREILLHFQNALCYQVMRLMKRNHVKSASLVPLGHMLRVWVCDAAHMGGFLGAKFSKQGSLLW